MSRKPLSELVFLVAVSGVCVSLTACGNSGSGSTTTPPVTPSNLSGAYVFFVTGTDTDDGDYAVTGSFTADGNGTITSAVADYNLGSGIDSDVPLTGTYTISGTTATVNLTDGGAIKDSFVTSLGSASAPISSFDGTGSGTLYPQVATSFSPAGSYNFMSFGEEQGAITGSGVFTVAASGGISTGSYSYQDGLTPFSDTNIAGFLGKPENGGRGQASVDGINLGYYVINSNQIAMIGLDDRALLSIQANKQ